MAHAPVTLVIPYYNRQDELARLLRSLKKLSTPPASIIIVDDNSAQPPLVEPEPGIELITLDTNTGPANAKNVGLEHATTKYVWFLDSDCEIEDPQMLEYGVSELEKDERLGIIGGEKRIIEGVPITKQEELLAGIVSEDIYHPISSQFKMEVPCIPSDNIMTRKSLLEATGGFKRFLRCGEDKFFCIQVRQMGYYCRIDGGFTAFHHHVSAVGRRPYRSYFSYARSHMFTYAVLNGFSSLVTFPFAMAYSLFRHFKYEKDRNEYLDQHRK